MSLDIGDKPIDITSILANTSILGLKDGVQAVRISANSLVTTSTTLDLDGGDVNGVTGSIIELDGGGA